jgi:hypothetical protein
MIVRHESDGTLVMITQNDHAQVSGFCAVHWGNERFERPKPFESAVRAAFLHDLAWLREETSPWFNPAAGRTINYLDVPNETRIDEYRWAQDWVASQDAYAGWLTNRHRTGIWKSRYGLMKQPHYPPRQLHPDLEHYVAQAHAEQDAAASQIDKHQLAVNYILLQIWDLFSLYICSTEQLKERCFEPVPTSYNGGAGVCMRLTPVEPARISVDPYPFDQSSLDLKVVYRRLPQQTFADAPSFRAAYFGTAPQIATFTLFDSAA